MVPDHPRGSRKACYAGTGGKAIWCDGILATARWSAAASATDQVLDLGKTGDCTFEQTIVALAEVSADLPAMRHNGSGIASRKPEGQPDESPL